MKDVHPSIPANLAKAQELKVLFEPELTLGFSIRW